MREQQHFTRRGSRNYALRIGEVARLELRVDDDLVFALFQGIELTLRQTKPPGLAVIRGAIRNPVRVFARGI